MTDPAAVLGAIAGLIAGPGLASLVHRAPQPGPWWAPWRPSGRSRGDTSMRERVTVTVIAVVLGTLGGRAAGWNASWPAFVLVALLAAPLVVIDLRAHRLPDRLVLPAAAGAVTLLGIAALTTGGPWAQAVVCGIAVLAVLFAIALAAPRSFGLGDVKLAAVLGLLLGWRSVPAVFYGVFAGFVIGAVVAAVLMVIGRAGLKTALPFGPSLIGGAFLVAALTG